MNSLSADERIRYSRQLMMPVIGDAGQQRLKAAKVFVAGLGGLGSVSAYYLAAAGIGSLKIVDKDHVALDNLNRQLLYQTQDIGRPKAESAHRKLQALNPLCRIESHIANIEDDNVLSLVADCHIIVDGTDNIETRKSLNLASVKKGIPFVFGGIDGFSGMVSTFIPGRTACLACLFPEKRSSGGKVNAIGPIPGIIASIQSLEVIKILLGLDGVLANTLWCINGMNMSVKTVKLQNDQECRCCGTRIQASDHGKHD